MLYQDRVMCFHAPGRKAKTTTQSGNMYLVLSSLLTLKVKKNSQTEQLKATHQINYEKIENLSGAT